ncbi:MAG: hypothetical protein K8R37_16005 [Bacteroidales bacterium]|nr:hypothetical protein [Bacteroidales bacterium]
MKNKSKTQLIEEIKVLHKKAEQELQKYSEHFEGFMKERTTELEKKNAELEQFYELTVRREFRIKELRDRVKELEGKMRKVKC